MCERHAAEGAAPIVLSGVMTGLLGRVGGAASKPSTQNGPADSLTPPAKASSSPSTRRLKLWELDDKLLCPVIGTCLSLEDIRKVAKKGGYHGPIDDAYQLHHEAVSISGHRNVMSEAIHKRLEAKHELAVRALPNAADDAAVLAYWQAALAAGDVAGPMWAALTHRHASADTRHRIYADVHMLSHQVGAGQAADLRRLEQQEAEIASLRAANHALRQSDLAMHQVHASLEAKLAEWRAENRRLTNDANVMRERLQNFESGQAFIALGRRLLMAEAQASRTTEVELRLKVMTERLGPLRAEKARLTRELLEVRAERDAMERLWAEERGGEVMAHVVEDGCSGACDTCTQALQGRCVLCVGGRTTLLPQYRQLAQRLGVRLIHHDGGKEEHLSRLPELLNASDAVICPTDCVGHLAYYQLKKHCKQNGKPCVLAKSSGVAGFAAALTRLAEGRADIHRQT